MEKPGGEVRTLYLVHVLIHARGHVEIHHQFDADQVQAPTQDARAHHHLVLSVKQPLAKKATQFITRTELVGSSIIQTAFLFSMLSAVLLLRYLCRKQSLRTPEHSM